MKTKLISLAVAVVVLVSDLSSAFAAGIIISPYRRRNYEAIKKEDTKQLSAGIVIGGGWRRKNYDKPQINTEKTEQLAYIILGGPRRRNYEAKTIENLA